LMQMRYDPVVNLQWGAPVRAHPNPPLEVIAEQYKKGWMDMCGMQTEEEWEVSPRGRVYDLGFRARLGLRTHPKLGLDRTIRCPRLLSRVQRWCRVYVLAEVL